MAEFVRVDQFVDGNSFDGHMVVCAFNSDTRREGTMLYGQNGKIHTAKPYPQIELYPEDEQQYMIIVTALLYKLTGDYDEEKLRKTLERKL